MPASASASTTLGNSAGSTSRMSSETEGAPVRSSRASIAGETSSRGSQLIDEALAVRVEQARALAADRLGDQEALAAGDADHRRRVELEELEVGEQRAGAMGEQHAAAERPRRVGRARPQRGGSAGADRDRARAHDAAVARSRARRSGRRRRAARPRARARRSRSCGSLRRERRELAHDAASRRAAAGVHDAPARMAALQAEREGAVAGGVEVDAQALEVVHALGRLGAEDRRRRAAHEPAAGALGVGEVALGAVVGASAAARPPCAQ